jgi:lipooligosaccharide transport system permease protein
VLLVSGSASLHLAAAGGLFLLMIAVLIPVDLRLLRRRVLGEG